MSDPTASASAPADATAQGTGPASRAAAASTAGAPADATAQGTGPASRAAAASTAGAPAPANAPADAPANAAGPVGLASPALTAETLARAARIRLVALDADGVLTDGGIHYDATLDLRRFDSRDGVGLKLLQTAGIVLAIISGRTCEAVSRRAAELGIREVVQGTVEKVPAMRDLLARHGLTAAQACFVGDDLPDLPLIAGVGLGLAPSDACAEVRAAARHVLVAPGGRGAVREAAELILRAQGRWEALVDGFRVATLE